MPEARYPDPQVFDVNGAKLVREEIMIPTWLYRLSGPSDTMDACVVVTLPLAEREARRMRAETGEPVGGMQHLTNWSIQTAQLFLQVMVWQFHRGLKPIDLVNVTPVIDEAFMADNTALMMMAFYSVTHAWWPQNDSFLFPQEQLRDAWRLMVAGKGVDVRSIQPMFLAWALRTGVKMAQAESKRQGGTPPPPMGGRNA